MDPLSIALWAQVVVEAGVGLAHCAIVTVFLWQQHHYLQERARILDEKEAQWRALFARQSDFRKKPADDLCLGSRSEGLGTDR